LARSISVPGDAVGAVGGARHHLVEEHHIAVPFLDPHGRVEQPRQLGGERGQFVEMGGEQGAAAVGVVQVLDRRPGDREPVEGRGAAADLVENHQRARGRLVEDRGGLDHFHHEGGAPAGEVVGRTHAGEQPVHHADAGGFGRHETPHLGQHRDQRVLAKVSGFAAHIGAGDEIDAPAIGTALGALGAGRWRQVAIIGDECGRALGRIARERLLDHRMAPAENHEIAACIDVGAHIGALDRERRERRSDIDGGERAGRGLDGVGGGDRFGGQRIEDRQFQPQRPVRRIGDAGFEAGEFRGGEADLAGERLAVDEGRVPRRGHEFIAVLRRDLDKIAEHIVVADFQTPNLGFLRITRLQGCHHAAGFIAQRPRLI
jgi:hypothetical protein